MEIVLAEYLGFCYGVKRAVKLAMESENYKPPVYTLGPLIHNPQIIRQLSDKGIKAVDSLDNIMAGTVIIRSHGVGPDKYQEASEKELMIIDATCPDVKQVQLAAKAFVAAGMQVVIIGEIHHHEVKSIIDWTGGTAIVVETIQDATKLPVLNGGGIVAQTTFPGELFDEIVKNIKENCNNIEVKRTICLATAKRQAAAKKLADEVDMMLIVGGKKSANTARLTQICTKKCKKVLQVESADEFDSGFFVGVNRIGITAGASSPDYLIEGVINRCRNLTGCMKQK
jgi:(E)-4-hydroxy-3-methyl-but-2-enyl pyrophosphate reductase